MHQHQLVIGRQPDTRLQQYPLKNMADSVQTRQTTLSGEEVVTRAIQFFSTESWRTTSQSSRNATFEGRPPVPWFLMLMTVIGYICCVIPGIIMWVMVVKKMRRFQNIVVATTTMSQGTEVTITHPPHSQKLASRFLAALPELPAS